MARAGIIRLKAGMRIQDRYKLVHLLGKGSMAEVWAAMDRASGGTVALKVISELMALSDQARCRFEREMQAIGSIHHPNVVALLGHGEVNDGRPFLVMEHVKGESLLEYMRARHVPVGVRGVLLLAGQVLEGLQEAHDRGIVHRDIKPANIFLAHLPSGRLRVKVLDFGVLHLLDCADDPALRLTRTGTIVGSPRYMAPEVARGRTDIDARADVFAVGATMYRALTGRPPFAGEGLGQILSAVMAHDVRPMLELRPGLPRRVVKCIERAMAHERRDRHASAAALRAALQGLLDCC